MNTQQYIINDITAFELTTKVSEVQNAFNQLTYSHIPVTKDGVFEGSISENDIHCYNAEKTLEAYQYSLESFHVKQHTNWLDILEAFALNNSTIMPVLSENYTYLGYYELSDIMNLFNDTPFLGESGGIIVVEKSTSDYSFSEICQIVESNDANILGVFVSKMENETTQITIKVGHTGINAIVQTFRRYNYDIVSNHQEDRFIEDLKKRSKYLEKYLKM
ncbi:MAG: acetoin utilization protein acuB [Patiriisocius sp.]